MRCPPCVRTHAGRGGAQTRHADARALYKGTVGYGVDFDHEAFYRWALQQTAPIFISEYQMPDDFVCVAEIDRVSNASGTGAKRVTERLFIPRHQYTQQPTIRQLTLF